VTYSDLLLPLVWLFATPKDKLAHRLAIYGIVVFILLKFIFDLLSLQLQLIYLDIYTLSEFLFFTALLIGNITSKTLKKVIYLLSTILVVFLLFQIFSQVFLGNKLRRLDSISVGIETILLFIFIFLFFYDHSRYNKSDLIYNSPIFWVSAGILVYLGGSLFFNILANYMTSDEFNSYWHYTYIAEIIKNILFSYALVYANRQLKSRKTNTAAVPYLDIDVKSHF